MIRKLEQLKEEFHSETDRIALDIVIGLAMWRESLCFCFWKFVHNALVHPMMAGPWAEPEWLNRLHDWTGKKCWGAG